MKNKIKTYKVWVSQVNESCITVRAKTEEDAREKAYKEWRKEVAHSHVEAVELQDD